MATTRIEWSGGWAELTDRLTHARRMRIVKALPKSQSSEADALLDFASEMAAAHVVAWSLGDVEPVAGPPAEALGALPADAVDKLTEAAVAQWAGRADPNATTPTSATGPSESASA